MVQTCMFLLSDFRFFGGGSRKASQIHAGETTPTASSAKGWPPERHATELLREVVLSRAIDEQQFGPAAEVDPG